MLFSRITNACKRYERHSAYLFSSPILRLLCFVRVCVRIFISSFSNVESYDLCGRTHSPVHTIFSIIYDGLTISKRNPQTHFVDNKSQIFVHDMFGVISWVRTNRGCSGYFVTSNLQHLYFLHSLYVL